MWINRCYWNAAVAAGFWPLLLLCQHSRVLEKLFAQVVAFLEKLGFLVKMEKCSVTPCHCIVVLAAHLDSTIVTLCLPQYCERTSPSPRSKEWIIEDSVHSDQMHEPCFSEKDHACPASLQKSPVVTPTSGGSIWPWAECTHPFNQTLANLERWVSESNHLNGCPIPHPWLALPFGLMHPKRTEGQHTREYLLGAIGRGRGTYQYLGVMGCHFSPQSTATCTQTCPPTGRQHNPVA